MHSTVGMWLRVRSKQMIRFLIFGAAWLVEALLFLLTSSFMFLFGWLF